MKFGTGITGGEYAGLKITVLTVWQEQKKYFYIQRSQKKAFELLGVKPSTMQPTGDHSKGLVLRCFMWINGDFTDDRCFLDRVQLSSAGTGWISFSKTCSFCVPKYSPASCTKTAKFVWRY
ncbi:hypothetical protein LJC22_07500 [Desulfosarcina sp. OttesenSCG-928-G10]|nr:hypothetical protein [Desulfosarcina sp. OttesenSCG-928-G10]MDL2320875.1 hypothetical protein [Desulfosarcina sp. OttesenSCG-928-B08]